MSDTNDSEFLVWFEEQCGPPPYEGDGTTEYTALLWQITNGESAKVKLKEIEKYMTAKTYALYAWNATKGMR